MRVITSYSIHYTKLYEVELPLAAPTIMAAAGHKAEEALHHAVNSPNGFLCVVEGAIPTKDNGIYGKVAGRTMLELCS